MRNPSPKHDVHIAVVQSGKKLSALDIVGGAHLKMVTNLNSRTLGVKNPLQKESTA